ncbi:MAG: hypothetical protein IT462_16840 [Planctomycetes bacterium]|nr:hypothetical protein [Planctomycetota bacterium]
MTAQTRSMVLVVDSCVAQSAGHNETSTRAISCRDILQGILAISHQIAFVPRLLEEWRPHRSGFTAKWLIQMYGRKKVIVKEFENAELLAARIEQPLAEKHAGDEPQQTAILALVRKDTCLVEAALIAEKMVISVDQRVWNHLVGVVDDVPELKGLSIISPEGDRIELNEWLNGGPIPGEAIRFF